MGSNAAREQRRMIEQQKRENKNWYDRRYYEGATQHANTQQILNMTEERIKQRNKSAEATAAVMGGTDESVAATKAANNEALADAIGTIAANADARKDNIEATYMQQENALTGQLADIKARQADALANATGGVLNAAGGIAGAFGGGQKNKDEKNN